jgi:hypothetical protein
MPGKYLALDLEIAKEIPDGGDWRASSPLGISCASVWASDSNQPVIWHGRIPGGGPSNQMSREESQSMVRSLEAMVNQSGYTLLTWNGLNFDFPVLAEESGLSAECKKLAIDHVDMMFHVFCIRGHFLGLEAAALGMGLPGKTPGMTGKDAPNYWAEGRHQEVLDYLAQDVRTTLDVARSCDDRGSLTWNSRAGNLQEVNLPLGWLPVKEALNEPEPDTSWMTDPPTRNEFTAWLND